VVFHRVFETYCHFFEIWDLRSGGVFETLKYDHAVKSLQFDTRKVVAATGDNDIKVGGEPPSLSCSKLATSLGVQSYEPTALKAANKRTHESSGTTAVHGSLFNFRISGFNDEDMVPLEFRLSLNFGDLHATLHHTALHVS
jgi:hypothetical protein